MRSLYRWIEPKDLRIERIPKGPGLVHDIVAESLVFIEGMPATKEASYCLPCG